MHNLGEGDIVRACVHNVLKYPCAYIPTLVDSDQYVTDSHRNGSGRGICAQIGTGER